MTDSLDALKQQFDIPGKVAIKAGKANLTVIKIKTEHANATVYLHGGHVTHFQPVGRKPVLFISDKSDFLPDKPIRGGVPVCFPWFGQGRQNNSNPPHGFARLLPWTLASIDEESDGSIVVLLMLKSDQHTRKLWPVDFELGHRITVGKQLTMSLEMRNTSNDDLTFEEALHTYFVVGDIHRTTVHGLQGASYLDKVKTGKQVQEDELVTFTGETDRVYNTTGTMVIDDPVFGRKIIITKAGSNNTVVWNPWIAKAKAMPDFGDQEWPGMVCVETANVKDDAIVLQPGGRHVMTTSLSVESR